MDMQLILKDLVKLGITTLTQETVKNYVTTKIKPIFENWGKDESRSIELEDCLSEYLLRCYAKNNIMTTIVFGRLQKTLDDLYIPLTLDEYRNEDKKWVIDETCYNILEQYDRILIIDKAGMGKSTIVKYFACQGINLDKCIPIVIELRKLDKEQSILEFIKKQLSSFDKNIEIDEIVNMLNKGEFVIFFDGYDEITNENKPGILDGIQEFVSNARNTKIVITSREEEDLNALGEFKCVNIKPLEKEEAYDLIKKYDNNGEISEKLIKRLEEDSSMNVLHEFLSNPLLVSLLYRTFEYKEEIPYKKIDFYGQVYEALFNDHDKTKGAAFVHEKKTKLDKYQFEQILRAFGFLCLKSDRVEYTSQITHHLLEQAIGRFGWLKVSAGDFLYDITHAVPFIQKDGNDYKWIHKSFMEYFASCFICYDNKENEKQYFDKIVNSSSNKYYNVLSFCYEIDTLGFRKYIILPYIRNYIQNVDKFFQNVFYKEYEKKYIEIAKLLLALNSSIWLVNNKFVDSMSLKDEYDHELRDKMFKDVIERYKWGFSFNMSYMSGNKAVIVYSIKNRFFYDFLFDKLPSLFKSIRLQSGNIPLIKKNDRVQFDDDINNPINKDKQKFYIIVGYIFSSWSSNNQLLDVDECKKLIKEIEQEEAFLVNNVFDL